MRMATTTIDTQASQTDAVTRAIAEPRRRQILSLIRDAELSAGEIAAGFEISRPAVSQHIAVLRDAGLLIERRDGTRRLYRARPEALAGLRDFIEGFWNQRLERLRLAAELEQQRRNKSARHRDNRRRRGGDEDRRKP
jgi:DNA-binding transcriptional ArsR family regulator